MNAATSKKGNPIAKKVTPRNISGCRNPLKQLTIKGGKIKPPLTLKIFLLVLFALGIECIINLGRWPC